MQPERFGRGLLHGFVLTFIVFAILFAGFAFIGFVVFLIQGSDGDRGHTAFYGAIARFFTYIVFGPAFFSYIFSPAATIIIGKRLNVGRLSTIYASILLWSFILAFLTAINFSFGPYVVIPVSGVMLLVLPGLGGGTIAYVVILIISRKKP